MDRQEITFLILIDLSAAFDTINHSLMIDILENDFGIAGVVKKWFESYLVSRQQRIMVKQHLSDYFQLESGLPQGSCLGPLLFLTYASGLFKVAAKHDTQLYLSFKPTFQQNAVNTVEESTRYGSHVSERPDKHETGGTLPPYKRRSVDGPKN